MIFEKENKKMDFENALELIDLIKELMKKGMDVDYTITNNRIAIFISNTNCFYFTFKGDKN